MALWVRRSVDDRQLKSATELCLWSQFSGKLHYNVIKRKGDIPLQWGPFTRVRTNFCGDKNLRGSTLRLHGNGGNGQKVWDLLFSGPKLAHLAVQKSVQFRWSRVNGRWNRASFCPWKNFWHFYCFALEKSTFCQYFVLKICGQVIESTASYHQELSLM